MGSKNVARLQFPKPAFPKNGPRSCCRCPPEPRHDGAAGSKATSPAWGAGCCHRQWYHGRPAQPFEKPHWDKYLQQRGKICFQNLVFHVTASRQEAAHQASAGEVLELKKDKLQNYAGPKHPLAARWALFLRPGGSFTTRRQRGGE